MQSAQPLKAHRPATNRAFAWCVHLYTASGAVAAFMATLSVLKGSYREAFIWLALSTIVDGTDGVLARLASVKEALPEFDGARLDDIVDYLTFVFVPVLVLYHSGTIAGGLGLAIACVVLLSSTYGFASVDAKTEDHFFTGFPSYWNIVALYLFAFELHPVANAVILAVLSALVFVRVGYVYPSRTPTLRLLTNGLGIVWAMMMVAVIALLPDAPRMLLLVSLFFPAYYTILSLALWRRRHTAGAAR